VTIPLDILEHLCYNPHWDLVMCHSAQVVVSHIFLFNHLPRATKEARAISFFACHSFILPVLAVVGQGLSWL